MAATPDSQHHRALTSASAKHVMNFDEARLQFVYEFARELTSIEQASALVRFATERVHELFEAEGSALILLDRATNELYFPVVRDSDPFVEARVAQQRFPADQGVAGWALEHGESVLVRDAQNDPRFYSGVDRKSLMTTRSLLCSPVRDAHGPIGVIEVVNPADRYLAAEWLKFLELLAYDISTVYERLQFREQQRRQRRMVLWATVIAICIGFGLLVQLTR